MNLNSQKVVQVEGVSASELIEHIKQVVGDLIPKQSEPQTKQDKLMTRKEVAELLGVSLPTLWAWTNKNILKSYRIGNKIRYKESEVLNALQSVNAKNN